MIPVLFPSDRRYKLCRNRRELHAFRAGAYSSTISLSVTALLKPSVLWPIVSEEPLVTSSLTHQKPADVEREAVEAALVEFQLENHLISSDRKRARLMKLTVFRSPHAEGRMFFWRGCSCCSCSDWRGFSAGSFLGYFRLWKPFLTNGRVCNTPPHMSRMQVKHLFTVWRVFCCSNTPTNPSGWETNRKPEVLPVTSYKTMNEIIYFLVFSVTVG